MSAAARRPGVLLLGWTGHSPKHLRKYGEAYGPLDSARSNEALLHLIGTSKAKEALYAREVLDIIRAERPLAVHAISNGGAWVLADALQLAIDEQEEEEKEKEKKEASQPPPPPPPPPPSSSSSSSTSAASPASLAVAPARGAGQRAGSVLPRRPAVRVELRVGHGRPGRLRTWSCLLLFGLPVAALSLLYYALALKSGPQQHHDALGQTQPRRRRGVAPTCCSAPPTTP